jgi:hypothetical protein
VTLDPATSERLGLNPLAWRLIAIHAIVLVLSVAVYASLGLSVKWSGSALGGLFGVVGLIVLWLNHYLWPGTPTERFIAEVVLILVLLLLLVTTVLIAEYAAVALKFPYADPWLANADALMGISVPALAKWTAEHPPVAALLSLTYKTFGPQLLMTLVALAVLRDRDRLWEYAFHFHLCSVMALVGLAIWPAVCAPDYLHFQSTLDESQLIEQIKGFHDGTLTSIAFDDLNGLISFPSFHVAGVMFVTWAFRHYRWLFIPLIGLNLVVSASTFMTGLHYAVDAPGGILVFGISLAAYRWWGKTLLRRNSPRNSVDALGPQSDVASARAPAHAAAVGSRTGPAGVGVPVKHGRGR